MHITQLLKNRIYIALSALTLLAAFFRINKINVLPPGITSSEALFIQNVRDLMGPSSNLGFDQVNGYSPLLTILERLVGMITNYSIVALRIVPALLGVIAVLATWFWIRSWFGSRTAWIAAFLMAVSPWAVTMSRSISSSALAMVLLPLMLLFTTRIKRNPSRINVLTFSILIVLNLLTGPLGWVIIIVSIVLIAMDSQKIKKLEVSRKLKITGSVIVLVGVGITAYITSLNQNLSLAVSEIGLPSTIREFGNSFLNTVLTFNLRGDQDFAHNLGGAPLLNVFIGLMFVVGLVLVLSNSSRTRYRRVLILFILLLMPTILASKTSPNASIAILVMPVVMLISAAGLSYMLGLWFATFPVNSAARGVGRSSVAVLLILSAIQGYTQYFHAWGGSTETYTRYNEAAFRAHQYSDTLDIASASYVIGNDAERNVYNALSGNTALKVIPINISSLPDAPGKYQFVFTNEIRGNVVEQLATKYPGGKLTTHRSSIDGSELFYDYVVTK